MLSRVDITIKDLILSGGYFDNDEYKVFQVFVKNARLETWYDNIIGRLRVIIPSNSCGMDFEIDRENYFIWDLSDIELDNIVRICLLGLFNGLEMIRVSKIAIVPSDFEFISKNVFKIPNYYNKRNYDVWYRTTIENLTFDIKEDNINRTKLNFMEIPKVSIQQEFEF